MTAQQTTDLHRHIISLLENKQLSKALTQIHDTAVSEKCWRVADDADRLEGDYRLLLDRFSAGGADPSRMDMHRSLIDRAYTLADRLKRDMLLPLRPTLYYNTLITSEKSLFDTINEINSEVSSQDSLFEQIASGTDGSSIDYKDNGDRLFYPIWVTFPLDRPTSMALEDYILSCPPIEASPLLSALLLGELEFHDCARLSIMADIYLQTADLSLKAQALMYLLVSLYKYRHRDLEPRLAEQLAAMADMPGWKDNIATAFIELIRTRDTERISRKMTDEIIPAMMNLRPEIMRKLEEIDPSAIDLSDPESLEANPEWEQMLKESGIEDKLKQMSEIQQDGGDVFMSTFSHLKRFPFFHDPIGWFTLFDPQNKIVDKAVDGNYATAESLASLPFLCDSDKFSLSFSLAMVPEEQRKMMFSQFEAQRLNLYQANMALGVDDFKIQSSRHLQNINRFLKLFRRKGEFYDPFANGINLLEIPSVNNMLDKHIITLAAEFFFKIGLWQESADAFGCLDPDATVSQKIGYCYEKLSDYDLAYKHYRQAEAGTIPSRWLLKRLTSVARRINKTSQALNYAHALSKLDQNDFDACMTLAYTQIEAGQLSDAICTLHRAEFIDEQSMRPWRALAWALFMSRDHEQSRRYYENILTKDKPSANDFFNYAHLYLAMGHTDKAIELYRRSRIGEDIDAFASKLYADKDALVKAGVDPRILPVVVDAVM